MATAHYDLDEMSNMVKKIEVVQMSIMGMAHTGLSEGCIDGVVLILDEIRKAIAPPEMDSIQ